MSEKITAVDLIIKFQELLHLDPIDQWDTGQFNYNKTRRDRYKQLISIANAFGIYGITDLLDGSFINRKEYPIGFIEQFIIQDMEKVFKEKNRIDQWNKWTASISERKEAGYSLMKIDLIEIYASLMHYYTLLLNVYNSNSGVYSASLFHLYPYVLTESINTAIGKTYLTKIMVPLAMIISPDKKEFTIEELKNDFGYVDVNIKEIDNEYF